MSSPLTFQNRYRSPLKPLKFGRDRGLGGLPCDYAPVLSLHFLRLYSGIISKKSMKSIKSMMSVKSMNTKYLTHGTFVQEIYLILRI